MEADPDIIFANPEKTGGSRNPTANILSGQRVLPNVNKSCIENFFQ